MAYRIYEDLFGFFSPNRKFSRLCSCEGKKADGKLPSLMVDL